MCSEAPITLPVMSLGRSGSALSGCVRRRSFGPLRFTIGWKSQSLGTAPERFRISGKNRHQGPPIRTPVNFANLSTGENGDFEAESLAPNTDLGVCIGPRRCTRQNGDCGRNRYLRNVWDMGDA